MAEEDGAVDLQQDDSCDIPGFKTMWVMHVDGRYLSFEEVKALMAKNRQVNDGDNNAEVDAEEEKNKAGGGGANKKHGYFLRSSKK